LRETLLIRDYDSALPRREALLQLNSVNAGSAAGFDLYTVITACRQEFKFDFSLAA